MINFNPNYAVYYQNSPTFSGIFHKKQAPMPEISPEYGLSENSPKRYEELLTIDQLKDRTKKFLNEHKNLTPCPKIAPENFYIDIEGYNRNDEWADFMAHSANFAALKIKNNTPFEEVLKGLAEDYSDFSCQNARLISELEKVRNNGISRLKCPKGDMITPYTIDSGRYKTYYDRLKAKYEAQRKEKKPEVPDFTPVIIVHYQKSGNMFHLMQSVEPGLKHSKEIYNELLAKYLNKPLNKKDINEINSKIGEMHWYLANATPFARGSDGITNAFIKSLYSALGFETSPLKSGVTADLEAFCSTKKDFSKNYTELFQTPPKYTT